MKRTLFNSLLVFLTFAGAALAGPKKGTVEVLYFKANLACCKARACNTLESTVKGIVEKNWTDGSVTFRQVKLSDTLNNELIKKYNAQSQTLVIVKTKNKKVTSTDISTILSDFAKTNDAAKFEQEFTARINEIIEQ